MTTHLQPHRRSLKFPPLHRAGQPPMERVRVAVPARFGVGERSRDVAAAVAIRLNVFIPHLQKGLTMSKCCK